MGLFDRIFFLGSSGHQEERDGSAHAETVWESDSGAREAIERHHDAIEERLSEHAEHRSGISDDGLERRWVGHVHGWDEHDGLERVLSGLEADPDPHVRALAARTLAMMPGRRAMEGLATALEDQEPIVREAAREALMELGVATLVT